MRRSKRFPVKSIGVVVLLTVLVAAGVVVGVAKTSKSAKATTGTTSLKKAASNQQAPASSTTKPSNPAAPISMGSLHIIGGPVAADGKILVLDVTSSKQMELSAIDPTTEMVSWHLPFSPSGSVPGEPFPPLIFGDNVVELDPISGYQNPTIQVQGIDIATGDVAWTYPINGVSSDAPYSCGPSKTLCLSYESEDTEGLVEIDATGGFLVRTIPNVEQSIGDNIYVGTQTPMTLMQIGSVGQLSWQKTVQAIFGPADDDVANGWDIDPHGSLDVGSLGVVSATKDSYSFGSSTTTAFAIANGRVVWTDPGEYNCMGTLEVFSTPTICRFKGVAHGRSGNSYSFSGVTLALEGFNINTGKISWSQPVSNVEDLAGLGSVPFVDGNDVVVSQSGHAKVLNLVDGKIQSAPTNGTFWCASIPVVDVDSPSGLGYGNQRVGTDQFYGCNSTGKAVSTLPSKFPSLVGVSLDGKFFWASPNGLRAVPLS